MKEISWTRTARLSLKDLAEFTLEKWNDQVLSSFLDQLDFRIEQLRSNPHLGSPYQKSHYKRLIIHQNVSLFYVNEAKYIKILLIWDNRSNPDNLLLRLSKTN